MNVRFFVSIVFSIGTGLLIYYFYYNFLTGMNLVFNLLSIVLLTLIFGINVWLIRREKISLRKFLLTTIMVISILASSVTVKNKIDNLKVTRNGNPRRYLVPSKI